MKYIFYYSVLFLALTILSGVIKRFGILDGYFWLSRLNSILNKFFYISIFLVCFSFFVDYKISSKFLFGYLATFLILVGLDLVDVFTYPNYLYSNSGIQPERVFVLLLLCLLFWVVILLRKNNSIFKLVFSERNNNHKKIINILVSNNKILLIEVTFFFVYVVISIISNHSEFFYTTVGYWGVFPHQYESFINMQLIPKDCPIVHPPKYKQWETMGSQQYLRYFLFPSVLVNSEYFELQGSEKQFNKVCIQSVESVDSKSAWPIVDLKNKEIDLMTNKHAVLKYSKLIHNEKGYWEVYL